MRTGKDRVQVEGVNEPVGICKVCVSPREIVIADANDVVFVPRQRAREAARVAGEIDSSEACIRELNDQGSTIAETRDKLSYHTLQRKIWDVSNTILRLRLKRCF